MSETLEQVAAEANQLQLQYAKRYRAFVQEALMDFTDSYSSARQGYLDDDGERWTPIGGAGSSTSQYRQWTYGFADESQLFLAQAECRNLVFSNEFAINGHENRISYIVGAGHTYSVAAKKDVEVGDTLVQAAQAWFDEFLRLNRWQCRQQEILKRRDRDGEVFIRLFFDADGTTRVRFVEPEDVQQPVVKTKQNTFGIETDPDDVETVLGYYVGETNQFVDAREIQHRKANVDTNCKRGVPLFYPVRKNLRRAEKLLRNMSTVAGVQAAIAFIRKHASASSGAVSSWVSGRADVSVSDSTTGQVSNFSNYGPGTVLDSPSSIEYEFPSAGLDAAKYVQVLQAELRAIASRLVMPEFMLTSDASNANYSSTMVAEGPAVKKFAREQCELIEYDQDIFMRAMQHAVDSGKLPAESVELLTIQAEGPTLAVRDKLQEAQTDQIYVNLRCKSRQNIAQEQGWDYEQEQQNIESDREDYGQGDAMDPSRAKLALASDPAYSQSAKEQAMEAVAEHWGKDFGELV